MKSKSYIFLIVLIFMIVFSLSAVSADDSQITSDTVSGDVDVASVNPFGGSSSDPTHSGELAYDIPSDVNVKKADVYVNVYSGSASNTYGAIANVSLNTTDGENQIASEELWIGEGSADGTIYPVNDHTTKCYSDYQMHYDITDSLKGLEGSSILLKVDTFPMEGKNFDGRIKLIALVVAYDDGDDDAITYFVDSTQRWTNSDTTTTFKTSDLITNGDAELINIALSNSDGAYSLNGALLGDADNHTSGNYYQYNYWNVTDKIEEGNDTAFLSRAGQGAYGPSIKNVLTVLKVDVVKADATLTTEYTSVYTCYAGTNNTLTIKTSSNKAGKYVIELLADGEVVNSTETEIDGETTILLTDPTVRDIDETTVAGANNTQVVYAVNIKYEDVIVGSANITVPVLYNGYLSKNFAYNASDAEFIDGFTFTGDIVFDIKDASSYKSGAEGVNEIWTVDKENITDAFIYVPYNWFNPSLGNETEDMFKAVFNGVPLDPIVFFRDQANIGKYAKYGYGIVVYYVSDLIKTGDNTFNLTKLNATPTVYPTALVYGYDSPDKDAPQKAAYILYGADLLANDYNKAGRIVEKYTEIYIDPFIDATLYVMAAGAQKGEGNLIVDGKEFSDVWNGTTRTTDLFTTNITDIATGFNEISFVATGGTILALPQIIVTTPKVVTVSAATEYKNTCYAGTNNTLTVNLNANANGTYLVELYTDGFLVASTEVDLAADTPATVYLTDPTIRDINETTVNGAENNEVEYEVFVKYDFAFVGADYLNVPVLYNGNLGYDMEYNVIGFEPHYTNFISGDVVFDVKDDSTYLAAGDMNRTDVWTVNLDEGCEIDDAYIFIPYNWFNPNIANETEDMFNVTFNGENIEPESFYRDQSNLGGYGRYGYGILIYRVVEFFNASGDNTLVINKNYATPAVYPSTLVYIYNDPKESFKEISLMWGADLLANSSNVANRPVKSDTMIDVFTTDFVNATLYVLAASAQKGEGNIIVNEKEFNDVWSGSSKTTDLFTADITDILAEDNNISFVATGSTILALPQIIVVDTGMVMSIDSIKTEYTSVPAAYAGTNNTLTVTVTNSKKGEFIFYLAKDSLVVDVLKVNLTNGTNTVLLTDPTIMDVDETTVNGADNNNVSYLVVMSYHMSYVNDEITVPVLYNGNLGYDMEYNVTGFEPIFTEYISGDVVVDVKDDSTYLAAGDMNRTDVWAVNLDEGCEIIDSYIFIPYNWFNPNIANETEGMFNVTFNGENIEPESFYRDQGNLGKYGRYGYGILIYNVYGLINASGDNTLVINKNYATPAVYPSTLVYIYYNPKESYKEISLMWGADLLSNANNNANRTVKSDTMMGVMTTDFENATLYVLAAGAQKGEGNIIVNGNEFKDVWSGSTKTTDLFTADITDILANLNNISFVATGSTILALPQIIVVDTGMVMSIDSIKTEYTSVPAAYAGTNNTLTVTVSTNREGEYKFELFADGHYIDEWVINLTNGTNTVLLTDPTIRDVDETTVNGADNNNVTYTVIMGYGTSQDYNEITVPVLYNGNLGYDLEYDVDSFEYYSTSMIYGDIVFDVKDDSTYLAAGDMNRTDVWTINLDEGSEIDDVYIFIPYNWFNPNLANETEDMFDLTFNGIEIVPIEYFRDQGNLGKYGKYGYGVLVYRVDNLINASGDNTLVLNKKYATPAVYPSALVYTTRVPGASCKEISIAWGADLLSNANNNANRTVKSDTLIGIDDTDFVNATLYVLAAGAQKGESNIIVNGKEFSDVWNGTTKTTDLFTADITDVLADLNYISFVATGSTILALPQIIVSDTGIVMSIDSIKTEYTSVPTCYAGTNNTITVTVTTNKDGEYELYLYSGLKPVDALKVNLTNGTHKLLMTDPIIRDIDETTVNGADNKNVSYTVGMYYKDYFVFDGIEVPLLYNGNLGKEYEYNATYIEDLTKYTVDGGIEVDIKPDSTYMNAAATNRTDVFLTNINFDVIKAFVYVPYNWDKTGVNGPVFNATFNGVTVTPKATYRDQSNLGKYGQYGYGLYIYDVTDLTEQENTFVLNKESGLTAVYPSAFIYLYNQTNSTVLYNIYMADGVDLLANTSNLAGRIVETDTIFNLDDEKVATAFLSVFAASAQAGEGDIRYNGILRENVWNGTSNSLEIYNLLVPRSHVFDENEVSFVATGSTILALNQIYVTIGPKDKFPVFIDVNVTDVAAGDNVTAYIFTNGATGFVTVKSDIGPTQIIPLNEYGGAEYTIENAVPGTHYVLVSYEGDEIYESESVAALFDVGKLTPTINVTVPSELKLDEFANMTIEIPGATGNVTVIIDCLENKATLIDGIAILPFEVTFGEHSIVVIYNGDDVFESAYATSGYYVELFESEFTNLTLNGDLVLSGVLVNTYGEPIANAKIDYVIGGVNGTLTTAADGSFAVQAENNAVVSIAYLGTGSVVGTHIDINIQNIASDRLGSEFNVTEGISIKSYAVDTPAGEVGQTTSFKLTDSNGNPIVNATVKFAYKTVILNRTTDENGIVFIGINTQVAQEALCAMSYLGDEKYNATFVAFSFDIQKKPITITASAKTYKASAKTKKYTVTIKTEKCNSNDGKVYLSAGKKITMKINGKTLTAKTNSKGQATFKISINKRGKYSSTIKFAGDKTYDSASKSVKITIK